MWYYKSNSFGKERVISMQKNRPIILNMFHAILFLCAFFLAALAPRPAAAEVQAPVRVGYSTTGSMLYQDEHGTYRGYDVLYLYEIARYTGWTYEFIPYDNWAQAVADVAAGKIDLLPTVMKTPEREQEMLFSLYPMAQTKIAIVKRPDDMRYSFGSVAGLAQARVAVRKDTADTDAFETWMQRSGLACTEVPYENRGELLAALDRGAVDLAALAYVGDARNYPAVQEFSPRSMYFALPKSRPDLSSALDRAMEASFLYNDGFTDAAMALTQPTHSPEGFFLTEEERAYLDQLPTLRVAFLEDNAPVSYVRDGKLQGIAIRILERVADLTGLSFEFVPITDRAQAVKDIHAGRLDMLGSTFLDFFRAHDEGLRLTVPYYSGSAALVERPGRTDPRIGVGKSTIAYLPPDRRDDPNLVTYPYLTFAMQDLADGKIDAAYCDTATASYYIAMLGRRNVTLKVLPSAPIHIGLAIDQGADPRLGLALDHALRYLSDTESDEIVQQEASNAPLTLGTLFDRLTTTQMNLVVLVLVVLLAGIAYFAFMIWRQGRIERRVAEINRQQETLTADLAWEKKVGAAQMGFYRYIDANLLGPLCEASRALTKKGAAQPGSPYHEEFVRVWHLLDFLFELRTLNALTQDDPGALVRERQSPFYQPDPDWQATPCRSFFEQLAAIVMDGAERRGLTFAVDFSGVLDTPVLLERRGFSMVLMRLLGFLMRETPERSTILFSAALSQMAAENGVSLTDTKQANFQSLGINTFFGGDTTKTADRAVLWLFLSAPELRLAPAFTAAVADMRAHVLENPRAIYESLLSLQHMESAPADARNLLRLAILQLIIPGLGGEWEIHSTEEKGTEITVEFLLDIAKN